jgi:GNAT superfamily N-acetyltransferase
MVDLEIGASDARHPAEIHDLTVNIFIVKPEIIQADLADESQVRQIVEILNAYAKEPGGGCTEILPEVQQRLIKEFHTVDNAIVFLAMIDGDAAGAAVCFRGYSTFAARPLLNIHDLAVLPEMRNRGIGTALLDAVADHARSIDCCKLTLEVLHHNEGARRLYKASGFRDYGPEDQPNQSLFLQKSL